MVVVVVVVVVAVVVAVVVIVVVEVVEVVVIEVVLHSFKNTSNLCLQQLYSYLVCSSASRYS